MPKNTKIHEFGISFLFLRGYKTCIKMTFDYLKILAEIVVLVRTPEIAFHAEISKRLGWHKPGSP